MSGIKVGETYKNHYGDDVDIVCYDEKRGFFVGWDGGANAHRTFNRNGGYLFSSDERFNLIIPPSLPWEWIVGDWYLRRNGDAVECSYSDRVATQFRDLLTVFSANGLRREDSHEDGNDIVAHLGPLPLGVYHVSDGDTQLLKDMKRWQERGGKVEEKERTMPWKCYGVKKYVYDSPQLLYRAHGCTDDREFPQPAKPLQMRAGPCRTRDGREAMVKPHVCGLWNVSANESYLVASDGTYYKDDTSPRDIIELFDHQPDPKPDPMKRTVTFADWINVLDAIGVPESDRSRDAIRQVAAESQP